MRRKNRKIINDPVHGFIAVNGDILFDIIDSFWFQRLRRIKQLGLTHLVYPGAIHTRFHHALGAMYLMQQAIDTLRLKGHTITPEEEEGALLAILMHDIGHGPFSHALEYSIVKGVGHEKLSLLLMQKLNYIHGGALDLAIDIFTGRASRQFLHHLVSGQLDVDRLDYLMRDSFFTGVSEGVIGTDRIIKMLNIVDGQLVIEQKGVYSIEKFLLARRLMYWQVYLHKTVLAAECLLKQILSRAFYLSQNGEELFATPQFSRFLKGEFTHREMDPDTAAEGFACIDDFDVIASVKTWINHPDKVLSRLSEMLMTRSLFRCKLQVQPFLPEETEEISAKVQRIYGYTKEEAAFFVFTDITTNSAYTFDFGPILILMKDGRVLDLPDVSDQLDFSFHSKMVVKHYQCSPRGID